MSYYRTCPHCGANLDPGERCDCRPALQAEARSLFSQLTDEAIEAIMEEIKKAPVSVTSTDRSEVENINRCTSISHDNRELEKLQV